MYRSRGLAGFALPKLLFASLLSLALLFGGPAQPATASTANVPDIVTNLDGSASSTDGSVDLTWTAPNANGSAITGYTVQARPKGTGLFTTVSDTDGSSTDTQATIAGLDSCTAYDFQVFASNGIGAGSASSAAAITAFGTTGLTSYSDSSFTLAGGASDASGTLTLTTAAANQSGAVWANTRFDLTESFCVSADIKLSATASTLGADGLAFVLQPSDTSSLSSGGGLGYYSTVKPSLAVEFDTYSNGSSSGDSASGQDITLVTLEADGTPDWTAFGQANYDVTSNSYTLEDGNFHAARFQLDADQDLFTVMFDLNADGDFADTGEVVVNEISADLAAFFTTEASSTDVYWGFTAATGGSVNLQQVRNIQYAPSVRVANMSPTVTSPGSQTVAVGSSKSVTVTMADSGQTTQAQWRVSATSANTSSATASALVASSTTATVTLTGVDDADTTITVEVTDSDGATASTTFALKVGNGSPSGGSTGGSSGGSSDGGTGSTPVATPATNPPVVAPARAVVPPQLTPQPRILTGPVRSPGRDFDPSVGTRATVGGARATVSSTPSSNSGVLLRTGSVQLGFNVAGVPGGGVSRNPGTNSPELTVPTGQSTRVSGGGLLPGSQVQVWLPSSNGSGAKELARIPVKSDGSFDSQLSFTANRADAPIAIGRQVMQVTGYDAQGNQTVVDMTINIAQRSPEPEPNRLVDALPKLGPGQLLATSAGVPEIVTIEARPEAQEVAVTSGKWAFNVSLPEDAGRVEQVAAGANITLTQSRSAAVSGEGFQPDTRVDVWLFSTPTLLGSMIVSADGSVSGEVYLDSRFAILGEHTLQLQGVAVDGFIKAANLGVVVQEPVVLSASGASALMTWVAVIVALIGMLVVVTMLASRRRRRFAEGAFTGLIHVTR